MKKFVKLNFFQINQFEKGFYLGRSDSYLINIDKIVTLDSCLLPNYYTEYPNAFNFGDENYVQNGEEKEYPIIFFEPEYFNQFIETTGIYRHIWLRDELYLDHNPNAHSLVATCSFRDLDILISADLTVW